MRIAIAGGGTGGHVFPALAVARELRARDNSTRVLWLGQADSLEQQTAAADGIEFATVAVGKLRRDRNPLRMLNRANVTDMARVPIGVAQAVRRLRAFAPDVVLTTGGYVAVPVGVAAGVVRVPLVVHEQTVGLGLANKVLARIATAVAVTSEASVAVLPPRAAARAVVTGNPVRESVLTGSAAAALERFGGGFDPGLPTVLVTGGAQGAHQINTALAETLESLLAQANVIHQAGAADLSALQETAAALPGEVSGRYVVVDFIDGAGMADALASADVVVCRAGAGTIAELTALGKAAVLIPLASSAGGEQARAARLLERAGAAITVSGTVTGQTVSAAVSRLLADPDARARLGKAARELGRPDAGARLAELVRTVAAGEPSVSRTG
ncbi:undecaprenyldiphospho-muramoylpentapeptide beta-N-acetylglucosaminyltransferase [Nocardia puris]|uniref:undecaprenyldiphospho-muramoylpentapeptide beta-N-acetylglucosaminyltransferase n=1 Tax=Nocardia puris TaxID=208602 RepID=UPI00189528F7|nr:undecaprenyldiphospho-muramoylpentapeptide beta-N-acetylglucosaminyltransferase [Nocardia puris]MBF6214750.1 undecaprenyldiphospho-muramoylpentapeptide beta-N-acetylglucosaminyltransferase [Nocardia puris]MBF6368776.1 undecaprenyldiphospho-muramoylpentapeptide beta-N-acetylglucosaminyltransferase [Nocardia puris]MBF6462356.1 undecaprenyldiphospho-muramoylpentapeptide beta-N-acetylglucosaminyltransferase [Nocardia puris]